MAKQQLIKTRNLTILAVVLLVTMVSGSVWDYPISRQLYNSQSAFGAFFAAYGELPAAYCLITAGVLLFMGRNKARMFIGAIQIICGVASAAYGAIVMVMMPIGSLPLSPIMSIAIGVTLSVATIIIAVKFLRGADRGTMLRVALVFILSIAAQRLIIDAAKIIWARPRMRMILETPGAYFTPWWTTGGELMGTLTAAGVGKEWFTSFPSGHTANAASALMLALLPLLNPSWARRQSLIFFIGAAWGLIVALSRVISGMHFVTDTVVGFAVMLLAMLCFTRLLFKNRLAPLDNDAD